MKGGGMEGSIEHGAWGMEIKREREGKEVAIRTRH
jgi:hypothetical protein